jgi:hypothetical protein
MEKRRGDAGFMPARGSGLADGARADAIPNAAGGEGGHGPGTPDAVIHRYISNLTYRGICEKAAESGVLSTAPQTRGPRRFKLVLASCAKLGRF